MEKKSRKKPIIIIFIILIIAIVLGLGTYGYYTILNTDVFYEGISIDELDISLLTKEEALELIKDKNEAILDNSNMKLHYEDKEYNINLRELGFHYEYDEAIEKAYAIGREGNIIARVKEIMNTKKIGINIPIESKYDKGKINGIVSNIAEDIDLDMKNAEFNFNGGNIVVTDETVGKKVNEEELYNLIDNNISTLETIEIPVEDLVPNKTKALLSRVNGIIGEFSTSFKGSSKERIENIRLSSKSLSKNLIMPGQTVSFNDTTGPRSKKAGYKEANIILHGEFVPDTGGGVCQTSTTLYNALLRANLTIVERMHHSVPIKYVPLGQDAAVAYGVLDLKFRNDFDYPIYIDSKVTGDRVYIYIYGDKNTKDYSIKLDSELIEEIPAKEEIVVDKSLAPGTKNLVQSGRNGYRVNTYKSVIKNGKVVSRDLITKDFYKPRNYIYMVNEPNAKTVDNKAEDTNETNEPNESED